MEKGKGKKSFNDSDLKKKIKEILAKSKKLDLIKPLSSAFENTPVEKEEHKGNIKAY